LGLNNIVLDLSAAYRHGFISGLRAEGAANEQPAPCGEERRRFEVWDPRCREDRVSKHATKSENMANLRRYSPSGLFIPAKTHPDVVVQAVAARDPAKASKYAQEHGIPDVKGSYQGKVPIKHQRKCNRWLKALGFTG